MSTQYGIKPSFSLISFAYQKSEGGARRGAPMVIEWGPIARLVAPLGAWGFLLKSSALVMSSRWDFFS